MKHSSIREAILGLLHRVAPEADLARLKGELPLREQIDFDSMDALNIFAGLSETFGMAVPETDYGRLQSLDDMVAYVAARVSGAGGRG